MLQSDQIRMDCIFTGGQPMCNRCLHDPTRDITRGMLAADKSHTPLPWQSELLRSAFGWQRSQKCKDTLLVETLAQSFCQPGHKSLLLHSVVVFAPGYLGTQLRFETAPRIKRFVSTEAQQMECRSRIHSCDCLCAVKHSSRSLRLDHPTSLCCSTIKPSHKVTCWKLTGRVRFACAPVSFGSRNSNPTLISRVANASYGQPDDFSHPGRRGGALNVHVSKPITQSSFFRFLCQCLRPSHGEFLLYYISVGRFPVY